MADSRTTSGWKPSRSGMGNHGARTEILAATARELIEDGAARGARVRLLGGLGIYLKCPEHRAYLDEHRDPYSDIDLVTTRGHLPTTVEAFRTLGLEENQPWKMLFGHQRRIFYTARNITVELYIDRLVLCQRIDLRGHLARDFPTLETTDLFLSKFQRIGLSSADRSDLAVLLAARGFGGPGGIDRDRLASLTARSWRWWKTFQVNVAALRSGLPPDFPERETVLVRIAELEELSNRERKTFRWRLRALAGERLRWYHEVEDGRSV